MIISYSSFNSFKLCPRQYKFSFIDKIKTVEKPELYFGGLIHKIIQFTLKKDPILPKEEELIIILKNNWRKDVFGSPEEAQQYYDFGVEMLRKFYNNWRPGLRNIVASEKYFQVPLNEKHILSGVIDRIDKLPFGAYEVIDYKTSKALPSQIEIDHDKQLAVYNYAVENLWPEAKDIRLTLYFLKHNTKITTTCRPDEVESIKQEIISTANNIEEEKKFEPRKNPLCDWCSYKNICPAWQNGNVISSDPPSDGESRDISNIDIDLAIDDYITAHQKIQDYFDLKNIDHYSHKYGTISRSKTKKLSVKKIA